MGGLSFWVQILRYGNRTDKNAPVCIYVYRRIF